MQFCVTQLRFAPNGVTKFDPIDNSLLDIVKVNADVQRKCYGQRCITELYI